MPLDRCQMCGTGIEDRLVGNGLCPTCHEEIEAEMHDAQAFWSVARWCSVPGCPRPAYGRVRVDLQPHPDGIPRPDEAYCFCASHSAEVHMAVREPFREDDGL